MARKKRAIEVRQTAPQHIHWKLLRTYKALYRTRPNKLGQVSEITIRSVSKPPKTRTFRSAGGRRKFRLVKAQTSLREVIIVAKTKNRKKAVDKDEIEEIEALEELEELEDEDEEEEDVEVEDDDDEEEPDDEDEDEDEDDEDEDEEDEEEEAPKSKKSKSKKSTKSKKAKEKDYVGTAEVAEAAGIDGRSLRMLLRKHSIPVDDDSGRYQWSSLKHPQVVKILKLVKSGEAKRAKKEQLDNLKAKKAKKSSGSTKSTKSTSKKKKRAKKADDDDE